jgi:ribosomal protein S12 methylthiotransferase accessory factor
VDEGTPLWWCEARRWPTAETVLVPLDVAAVSHADLPAGYRPFTTPLTNGQGAGPSLAWALAHGLGELIQRDGNGLLFRAMDAGVVLDLDAVEDPRLGAILERLRAAGIEVLPKFASDDFGMANVYVVGAERPGAAAPFPIMATACGEAAAPDRERALLKAVTEFAAARARKAFTHGPLDAVARVTPPGYVETVRAQHSLEGEEGRAMRAMLAWLELDEAALRGLLAGTVLSRRGRKAFSELPAWGAPAGAAESRPGELVWAETARRLQAAGFDILYLDLGTDWAREAGVAVVKAIVPGLEVETMTYHRIGERNARKLLERGSPLVGRGAPPRPGCRPVRLTEAVTGRLGGPVWLDVEAVDRKVGELYPLYREPEIHSAQLALERRAA